MIIMVDLVINSLLEICGCRLHIDILLTDECLYYSLLMSEFWKIEALFQEEIAHDSF